MRKYKDLLQLGQQLTTILAKLYVHALSIDAATLTDVVTLTSVLLHNSWTRAVHEPNAHDSKDASHKTLPNLHRRIVNPNEDSVLLPVWTRPWWEKDKKQYFLKSIRRKRGNLEKCWIHLLSFRIGQQQDGFFATVGQCWVWHLRSSVTT